MELNDVNTSKPVFIVSPPRTGSSLITSMIERAGLFGGNMKPEDQWNKKGYYENFKLRRILIDFLRENDHNNQYKRFHPVNLMTTIEGLKEKVVRIMYEDGIKPGQRFFLKNFKMAFVWKSFFVSFPDAKWVFIERKYDTHIKSLIDAPFLVYDDEQGWNEFLNAFNDNADMIKNYADHYTVKIENVLNDVDEVVKLFAFCDIEYDPEIIKLIDRSLIHE